MPLTRQSDAQQQPKITLCLVDDHLIMRIAVSKLLTSSGFDLLGEAGDGETGIRLITQKRPDAAVVDWRLPEIDGREVVRRIKKDWPLTKVVVISAAPDECEMEAALNAGADSFLAKERLYEELAPLIRKLAGGPAAQPAAT